MPTYDYECGKCGFEFEREQRITADPIKTCPKCKSRKAKRLLSASGFILKGGGWYADGYGSSAPKSSEAGGGSDGASDASSSGDSDSTATPTPKESTSASSTDSGKAKSTPATKAKKSAA